MSPPPNCIVRVLHVFTLTRLIAKHRDQPTSPIKGEVNRALRRRHRQRLADQILSRHALVDSGGGAFDNILRLHA